MKHLLLIISFFFTSCQFSKDLYIEWQPEIESAEKTNLNGQYWNKGEDLWGELWSDIYEMKTFKRNRELFKGMDSTYVSLEVVDKQILISKLMKGDSIIDQIELNGKIVDNYFSVNQLKSRVMIPILYWRNFNQKLLLGVNSNDSLNSVSLSDNTILYMLILGGSGGGIKRSKYARKSN